MAKLDLEWLGVFVEVYRTQSVSRAAQRLGMAQASASIALGKLRRHFDDPLFSRTSRGMEPTPHAQRIYPDLAEALARLATARGTRIGFTPALEAGFYQQALFAQDFVCLAATAHPRVKARLTRRAFCAEGHLVVTTSGTGHSIVEKVLAKHKIERRAVLRVPSFLGVARIVAQTELLVIVPRLLGETLASQAPVQLLSVPVPMPSYKVKQHWHERFNADAGNVWLRRAVADLFAGGSRPTRASA